MEASKEEEAEEGEQPEEVKKEPIVPKKAKPREVTNPQRLIDARSTLQYLIDRNADRILILGSLGPKLGYSLPEYSLEPLVPAFKSVFDLDVTFEPTCEFANFPQMLEENVLPEGGTVLLENANFNPGEHGFIYNLDSNTVKLVSIQQQELFKERLSGYGKVYVNDAPNASLQKSASICGISPPHMLLGIRMKDILSKLSAFFMYSGYPFAAVLGGSNIKEQILLINSLIDTTTHIYLFGPLALYFLSALGVRIANYSHDDIYYAAVQKLVTKAHDNAVELVLPNDFMVIKTMPKKPVQEEKKEEAPVQEKPEDAKGKKEAHKEAKKGKQEKEDKKTGKKDDKKEQKVEIAEEKKEPPKDEKAELAARQAEQAAWIAEALKTARTVVLPEKSKVSQ